MAVTFARCRKTGAGEPYGKQEASREEILEVGIKRTRI